MVQFVPDEEVSKIVSRDWKWADDYREAYRGEWNRFHRSYKAYLDENKYPFDANLAIPIVFWVVETQLPYLLKMIFANGEFVEVNGRNLRGQLSASAVKDMLNYYFENHFDIYNDMYEFSKQLLMLGTSVYKPYWEYIVEERTQYIPEYRSNEFQRYREERVPQIIKNNPTGRVVDLGDFFVDPNASRMDNARYGGEDLWVDPIVLIEKQNLGIFKNVEKVLGYEMVEANRSLVEREHATDLETFQKSPYVHRGKVHLVDYWGYITKGWHKHTEKLKMSAKQQLMHCVVAYSTNTASEDDGVVLLAEETPYHHNKIPFVDARIHQAKGEFYGMGDIEVIENLAQELIDMRNMRLDNLNRILNQMYKIRSGMGIDESELVFRPGGGVHVKNMDDIEPLGSTGIDPAHFRETDDTRRDIEQISGVTDFMAGNFRSSTGFNDTATGISFIQRAALERTGLKGNVIQRAIRDIAQFSFHMTAQYQPYGVSVRALMPSSAMKFRFVDVSAEALRQMYDFQIVNSPASGNKELRVAQLIQLFQVGMPASIQAGVQIDWKAYLRRLLEDMEIPNPQELLGYPEWDVQLPQEITNEQEFIHYDPAEENRMMIMEGQYVPPKYGENHPYHIFAHVDAKNSTNDPDALSRLDIHLRETIKLHKQEKGQFANVMATAMGAGQAQMNQGQAASPAGPGGTQGTEGVIRNLGNVGVGNA